MPASSAAPFAPSGRFARLSARLGLDGTGWLILLGAVLLGVALRLPAALTPTLHHADELWQYLEPAYGLVTGRWVVVWEYRDGIRSWLVPMLFVPPIALGKAISPDGDLYRGLSTAAMVFTSLIAIIAPVLVALRESKLTAIIVGFVAASWIELVLFAPRAMTEAMSLVFFLAAWAMVPRPDDSHGGRRLIAVGLLLGLSFVIRFQLSPALFVLAVWACRLSARRWGMVIAGGLIALAIDSAANMAMGRMPFHWMVENFVINLVENKSASFGVEPPWWYLHYLYGLWGWFTVPIVALALIGARRHPVLLVAALANIAAHSLIPHKEYRFIILSSVSIALLAAWGTAMLLSHIRAPRMAAAGVVLACGAWFAASAIAARSPEFELSWFKYRPIVATLKAAGDQPRLCGLAAVGLRPAPRLAQYFVDADVSLYQYHGPGAMDRLLAAKPAFNVVLMTGRRGAQLGPEYRLALCSGINNPHRRYLDQCVYVREGNCTPSAARPADDVNRALQDGGV